MRERDREARDGKRLRRGVKRNRGEGRRETDERRKIGIGEI